MIIRDATVNGDGQLGCKGWCAIDLQCLHHKIGEITATGGLTERMTIRVQDFSDTNFPDQALTVYRKEIVFNPERFECLIHAHPNRTTPDRNQPLLNIAKEVAGKWGF